MDKIFIEGQQVDSSEIFSTMVSYLIDDIRDFGAKNCNVSKTILLPGTKRNAIIFGGIYNISSFNNYDATLPNVNLNFNTSVKAQCHVFRDNLQSVKGVVQLLGINIVDGVVEYELGITGELGGFISALGAALLTGNTNTDGTPNTALDLDFSAYDQLYTIANIQASKANVGSGSGVVYPLIDYGTYSTGKHDWQYKTFRPALFVKEYIDKIFAASGYTYDCPLFSTSRFKGLVVPHNIKDLKVLSSKYLDVSRVTAQSFGDEGTPDATSFTYYQFTIITLLGNFTTPDNKTFTYAGSSAINVTLSFKSNISGNLSRAADASVNLFLAGTGIASESLPLSTFSGLVTDDGIFTIENVTINPGDTVYVQLISSENSFGDAYSYTINSSSLLITGLVTEWTLVGLGENITINDTLPKNILQSDFISSICKLFNLYIYEDPLKDKHLRIAPFSSDGVTEGFYSLGAVDDWTNYLDLSQAIKIKPMGELNARYYEFNYKDDSDFHNDAYKKRYNKTYGSFKYDSNYQFSMDSHKVEVIFSGTPIVGYQGEDKVYSTILKSSNGNEETIDSNIRILQTKVVTGVTSWNILAADNTTVLGTYTDYLYAGHFDNPDVPTNDIGFGVPDELFFTLLSGVLNVNQFNVYWSAYLAELTDKDARLVTATFKLPLKEIANLDFGKYKYIAGVLYRLNKIIDYNTSREDTCSVEVIKVINKIY